MEELPTFIDDLFFFGFLAEDEVVTIGNKKDFRKGNDEASKRVAQLIHAKVLDIFR